MSIKNYSSAPRVLLAAFVLALGTLLASSPAQAAGPYGNGLYYVVQYGDTLSSIAARFGVSVQSIIAANRLGAHAPYVGGSLYMPNAYPSYSSGYSSNPVGSSPYMPNAYAPYSSGYPSNPGAYGSSPTYGPTYGSTYGSTSVYVVQPGDTLGGIAQRFGVAVYSLTSVNHIYNPNFIFTGMRLVVPQASYSSGQAYPSTRTYIVQVGDTLSAIALRFGTTVYSLMVSNNIPNPNLIFTGMRLTIPSYSSSGYSPSYGYTSPQPSAAPPSTPAPGSTSAAVSLMNIAYNPKSIMVHVGTHITWSNQDSGIVHTVTSGTPGAPSGAFDSGNLNSGQTFQFTFSSTGTFSYYCRIHGAAMTGTVTVIP